MLQIKNLSKKFVSKTILHDISCEIPTGTIGVFLGSSGTGKSTLLRIIAGLQDRDTGTLLLNDNPLQSSDVGMVFQHFNLFENLTVLGNITFGLCKGRTRMPLAQAQTVAYDLLERYGLKEFATKFPDELSGGQKQRLAILRTIAQKPAIICFDEPTSALDPLLKQYVARALMDLSRLGYTIIIATHDIQLVEQLPCTIFLMHAGAIIQSTSSIEFMKHPDNFPEIKKFMYHQSEM